MLKTNSKKAHENIRNYIINNFDPSNYSPVYDNIETFKDIAEAVRQCFESEKGHEFARLGRLQSFFDWCQGLPSVIDTCYYYNRPAVDDLGDILEESQEERNRYSEEQAADMLTRLIYRELY